MANHVYDEIVNYVVDQIKRLAPDEREWLLSNLSDLVRERMTNLPSAKIGPRHNVMEFKGVAKDFWQGIDVKQYIEDERNSWERE